MDNPTKLKSARFPVIFGTLTHVNQFLKVFSISLIVLAFMLTVALMVMMNKEPTILTLTPRGQMLERSLLPSAEDQVREGITNYLEKRYQWGPESVLKRLKESEAFILPETLKAFQGAVQNVAKFSIEKQVSQKIYPEKVHIELAKKMAFITGDRITVIQGMKAAGNLKLELSFESGNRTRENPWGVYITKEKEE